MNVEQILFPHNDGPETDHMRVSGIKHHHIRLVFLQIGRHRITPDGIARDVERFLVRVAQNHTANTSRMWWCLMPDTRM